MMEASEVVNIFACSACSLVSDML